jgi:hypothetical protein
VKRFFHDADLPLGSAFAEYESLEVSPQHIHKSKTDHKQAVFLLGKGLSEMVISADADNRGRLRDRFLRMADGKKAHPSPDSPATEHLPEPVTRDGHLPAFALRALSH